MSKLHQKNTPHRPPITTANTVHWAHAGPQRRGIVREHFDAIESGPFKTNNNSQATPEQLHTNFQKPLKTGFLTLKMVKITLSEGQNLT